MKKTTALLTALALSAGLTTAVYAENTDEVIVSVEKLTLGAGYVLEPTAITIAEDATASEAIAAAMEANGIAYDGYRTDGVVSYYTSIQDNNSEVNIPGQIVAEIENDGATVNYTRSKEGYLSENDYYQGGWMYIVNNQSPMVGSNEYNPEDGDVIQLYFSVYGWGADYGFGWSGNVPGVEYADKCDLMRMVAKTKATASETKEYMKALEVLSTYGAAQESVDEALAELTAATDPVYSAYTKGGEYLSTLTPAFGSEWNVLGLARSGAASEEFVNIYYSSVADKVKETEGVIGKSATDYARAIIGLTSIGKDARNIEGYSLVEKLTKAAIEKQGLNGAVYSLLALDSAGYTSNSDVTREWLVDTVLANKLDGGGWTFWGSTPDPDMTSMATTALAPYYNTDEEVKAAVDEALVWLSETQCESGAYASYGSECPESTAQVLVALTALGIDPDSDDRFIKNGNTLTEAIAAYAAEGGGFAHSMGGAVNLMASQQSYYALTAYYRFRDGKTSLYDMSDLAADISVSAADGVVTYVNNGTADANALSIIASYDESGRLTETKTASVEIKAGEEYKTEAAQGSVAYLWDNIEPLCEAIRN